MKNLSYAKPIDDGAKIEYAPASIWPNPGTPTEAEYNAAGWYRLAIQPPDPPEGKVVTATRFVVRDNLLVADYTYGDAPPRVRVFCVADLIEAMMQKGIWAEARAWIEAEGLLDLVLSTKEIQEDYPTFATARAALQEALGATDEEVEEILSYAEVCGHE